MKQGLQAVLATELAIAAVSLFWLLLMLCANFSSKKERRRNEVGVEVGKGVDEIQQDAAYIRRLMKRLWVYVQQVGQSLNFNLHLGFVLRWHATSVLRKNGGEDEASNKPAGKGLVNERPFALPHLKRAASLKLIDFSELEWQIRIEGRL